ncbi:DUF724 domain-containing protein 6-like [Cryptomeria japonica]|uniref:DUF724 domain-containing protein 6-like n=1 Tax=Cryptomeria japonica TaxID=3369 RepID=UPI0027D9EC8D|nr:DUF724 domain-containing protein 6-like [Cryptomeria japonica]
MSSLKKGEKVEVFRDEEGFSGVWFLATIVRKVGANFVVEFKDLMSDDGKSKLKETVEARQIRPQPPNLNRQHFELHEKVDAYDRDGWWEGIIDNVLADNNYVVYFPQILQKSEYHISHLRLHLEWVHGKCLQPSEGLNQSHPMPLQSYHENVQCMSSSPEKRSTRAKNMSLKPDKRSSRVKTISLKPERRSTRANKRQGEANVCGLSLEDKAGAQCSSFQNPVNKLTKKSAERKSGNNVPFDNGSSDKGKMDTGGTDLKVNPEMPNILNMRREVQEATGSHSKHETKFPMTIPCLEFVGEAIVGYPDNVCEIHTKASLKQIEKLAYRSSLMALYLQGVHTWKREMLLTELRQVLHITTEEHANVLTHITSGQYD